MENLLIEDFIKNNNLGKFHKEYLHEILVKLTDEEGTVMTLLNMFEDILVRVDHEDCGTFTKRLVRDDNGEKVEMWVCGTCRDSL